MKFTAKAGAFAVETGLLLTLAAKRTTIPICSSILVRADQSGLTLTATDLESVLRTHQDAEVSEPGSICISGQRLDGILRAFARDAAVTFELEEKDNWLRIQGPGSKLRMQGLSAADFPGIAEKPQTDPSTMPAAVLAEILRRASFAGHELDVKGLGSMFLHVEKGKATVGATNGNRACMGIEATEARDILIVGSRPDFELVAKLLRDTGGDVSVVCDETRAWFTVGRKELALKHMNDRKPAPLRTMLEKYGDTAEPVVIESKAFAAALRRAELLAPAGKGSTQVDLRISTEGLSIMAESPDGVAEEAIEAAYTGKPFESSFSASYLKDFLSAAASDRVTMRMPTNPQNAVILSDGDGHIYLCMPMYKSRAKTA